MLFAKASLLLLLIIIIVSDLNKPLILECKTSGCNLYVLTLSYPIIIIFLVLGLKLLLNVCVKWGKENKLQ